MSKIDELKKLPPEERIAKLRELEEENKKEIAAAKELLSQSSEEIQAKEEQEALLESIRVPEISTVDIAMLFAPVQTGELYSFVKDAGDDSDSEVSDSAEDSGEGRGELEEAIARTRAAFTQPLYQSFGQISYNLGGTEGPTAPQMGMGGQLEYFTKPELGAGVADTYQRDREEMIYQSQAAQEGVMPTERVAQHLSQMSDDEVGSKLRKELGLSDSLQKYIR